MDSQRPLYPFLQPLLNPETFSDHATRGFCLGIVLCFLAFAWTRNARKFSQSITTVVGILGTFVGIYIGLADFDPNDIEKSVPPLLAGLKTAFLTSIFGIGATFCTRIIDRAAVSLRRGEAKEGATVHEILQGQTEALRAQTEAAKESHQEALAAVQALGSLLGAQAEAEGARHAQTLQSLESIRTSVSGEGETSMLTQVQKFRTTFADKQDELIGEFRAFAESMAEANSQALIKALEKVIRDFNAKINEQFGDNFKQLNQAVGKLVVWQNKYAEQTQAMIAQFERTVSAVEQTRDAIAEIAERSGAITEAAERLAPVLRAIEEQRKSLAESIKRFAEVSEKAGKALPTLEAKVGELTDGFARAVQQSMEANQRTLDEQRAFARQSIEHMRAYMEDAQEQLKQVVSGVAARLHAEIEEIFNGVNRRILELAEENQRSIKAGMKAIDEGLQKELEKTLSLLGSKLASVSDRFAQDYTPLADRLREVVEIARGLGDDAGR